MLLLGYLILFFFASIFSLILFGFASILQLVNGTALGIRVLESGGYFTEPYWYWIGVASQFGFIFLFNFLFILALTYLKREYPFFFIAQNHHSMTSSGTN